jgi:hypothetical protein
MLAFYSRPFVEPSREGQGSTFIAVDGPLFAIGNRNYPSSERVFLHAVASRRVVRPIGLYSTRCTLCLPSDHDPAFAQRTTQ